MAERTRIRFRVHRGAVVRALATAVALSAGAALTAHSAASQVPIAFGVLGLFPLFVTICVFRPPSAFLFGAAWGLLLFRQLATWGWIEASPLSILIFALAPACHAGLGSWLSRWVGFSPLVLGVAWFGVEFAFSAAGLPRSLFAGAPAEAAILGAIAHGLGVVFVGFLAAYVSATLVRAISVVTFPGAPARAILRVAHDSTKVYLTQATAYVASFFVGDRPSRAPPGFGHFCC